MAGVLGLVLLLPLHVACSSTEDASQNSQESSTTGAVDDSGEAEIGDDSSDGDEVGAEGEFPEDASERKGGETYSEYDSRRDGYSGARGIYAGDGCTVDCGGHNAGYQWAEEKGITDPDQCGGNSWSFIEGCRAYAKENNDEEAE